MRQALTIVVAGVLLGCATPQMSAVDLAGHAQHNLMQAQQQIAGRDLIVTGVVQSTTLVPREQINVSGGLYYTPATATVTQEQVALVVLQPGSVLCFFEPLAIEDAMHVQPGQSVSLNCRVDSFRAANPAALAVLSGCRRP